MNISSAVAIVVLWVLLVILGPVLAIWSLNTLFPVLNIPLNWETWLAVVILGGMLRSTRYSGSN